MVDYDVHGNVLVMTINRPEAKNAVNGAVAAGIEGGIDRLEEDDDLWIGVLAAAGDVFCAGADLKEINSGNAAALMTPRGGFGGIVYRERRKPIIAAVDGLATAGGCEIVLSCDLVVASTRGAFGLAEVKRNLVAGAGGLFRLPRALPPNVAMEAILTATPIPAERAHQFGMVNRLTDPGAALDGALALAAEITENAPVAVWESRGVAKAAVATGEAELKKMTDQAFGAVLSSEDTKEGLSAFIEKRKPEWKGR
jgi:enoyl-CoA hydratase